MNDALVNQALQVLQGMPDDGVAGRYRVDVTQAHNSPYILGDVIVLPMGYLRYLWAACAYYRLILKGSFAAYRKSYDEGRKVLPAEVEPRLHAAEEIFTAKRAAAFDPLEDVPLDEHPFTDQEIIEINSMFARSVAFIVYHETGHGELDHRAGQDGGTLRAQEYEADDFAARQILEWSIDEDQRGSSQVGIVAAIMSISSLTHNEMEQFDETTHPHAYRRLSRTFELFDTDDNDPTWLFAALLIRDDLIKAGRGLDSEKPAGSLKESFEYHLTVLEEWLQAEGH